MKILVIQETDWIKRGPHQQHHLMERLSLKGHQIRVIDYRFLWRKEAKKNLYSKRQILEKVSKVYKQANITLFRPAMVKIPGLEHLSLIFFHKKEIARQIKEFKPEVIVGFGILNTYLAMKLAKKNGIPFIYYLIDVLHSLFPVKSVQWVAKIFKKKTLKDSNRVIVINDKLKDYAIGMGSHSDRTYLVRAGVDLECFNPHIDGSRVRKQYKITKNDFVLFFMGWLYDFSGLKEVALDLAKIKNQESNFKLLIVGEGDLYSELKKIQQKYNLQDKIILTGWQPYEKIPEFLKASDLCLFPAHDNEVTHNIVPIKIYEYMAAGKPVIATRLPGVVKEFGNNNGIIYVDEPREVVKRTVRLIKNGDLAEQGLRAKGFVKRYSWDNITQDFEAILEKACLNSMVRSRSNEK